MLKRLCRGEALARVARHQPPDQILQQIS
jgi:hypothetical protein